MKLTVSSAVALSCLISISLLLTGFVTIPFAAKYSLLTQNFIYFAGRIPIIFVAIAVYFNLGKD